MARELSMWAESVFGMTASHPAGVDTFGESRKDMWPSPEGTAPPMPEEKIHWSNFSMKLQQHRQSCSMTISS